MYAAALSLQVHPQAMQRNVPGQVNFNGETNGGYGPGMTQHDSVSNGNPGRFGPGQRDASHGKNGMYFPGAGADVDLQHPNSQTNRAQMVGQRSVCSMPNTFQKQYESILPQ